VSASIFPARIKAQFLDQEFDEPLEDRRLFRVIREKKSEPEILRVNSDLDHAGAFGLPS
jgi:hypothetical protein